jgi:hypothetical protein
MPSSPHIFVEPLESRRLMDSTMPLQPMWEDVASMPDLLVTNSTTHRTERATTIMPSAGAVRGAVPNLLGNWKGTVTVGSSAFATKLAFRLYVKKQTRTTLTGGITINNAFYSGTSKLRWSGRTFTITYSPGQIDLTLRGTVNRAGNAFTATATIGPAGKVAGHVSATRTV